MSGNVIAHSTGKAENLKKLNSKTVKNKLLYGCITEITAFKDATMTAMKISSLPFPGGLSPIPTLPGQGAASTTH